MNKGKINVKDIRRMYNSNINTFYRQADFEEIRKSGTAALYVIQQAKRYIGKPKPEERRSYYYGRRNGSPEIDKSGYNVTEARETLNDRLRQYKADKRARETQKIDYMQDIATIDLLFSEFRTKIIERVTKANTFNDYNALSNIFNYKLAWLVRDIEYVRNHAINKTFKSVESANENINNIKTKIEKLIMIND